MNWQKTFKYPAFAVVLFAAIGTGAFSRDFVKLKIGPLFSLEFFFLVWAIFAMLTVSRINLALAVKRLQAPLIFFLWGTALLLGDLLSGRWLAGSPRQSAQHCILFIYPLIWYCVGYWLQTTDPRFPRWILGSVLVSSSFTNLLFKKIVNLSLGPLSIIPSIILMTQTMQDKVTMGARIKSGLYSLLLAFLTFIPFWTMWNIHLQRTSLLLLIGMTIGLPFFLLSRQTKYGFALFTSAFLVVVLLVGFVVDTHPHNLVSVRHKIMVMFQHGEDVPTQSNNHLFQMRTRRFMSKTALAQWRIHPIIGIGFVPEVPNFVEPNRPNTGGFDSPGAPPVSGPHNSYLSILTRMGLIGLILFFFIVQQWFYRARLLLQDSLVLSDLLLIAIPANGMIYALFNVGFESPHNCMLMWLACGILLAHPVPIAHENTVCS